MSKCYPSLSFGCELNITLKHPEIDLRKRIMEYVDKWNARISDVESLYGLGCNIKRVGEYCVKLDVMPWLYEIHMLRPEINPPYGRPIILIKVYQNVPFHAFPKQFPEFTQRVLGISFNQFRIVRSSKRETIKVMREVADLLDQLKEANYW